VHIRPKSLIRRLIILHAKREACVPQGREWREMCERIDEAYEVTMALGMVPTRLSLEHHLLTSMKQVGSRPESNQATGNQEQTDYDLAVAEMVCDRMGWPVSGMHKVHVVDDPDEYMTGPQLMHSMASDGQ
jgi:hypothetical protein